MQKIKDNSWNYYLEKEFVKPYFKNLEKIIDYERRHGSIYPQYWDVFKAFELCPVNTVKVIIIGQDPYPNDGLADGMAFSVPNTKSIPPSLKNIFRALKIDLGIEPQHGELSHWAVNGVLLLNTILTVRKGAPMSHSDIGWQEFTDSAIEVLNSQDRPMVWLLWGKEAQRKQELIFNKEHLIIKSSHPSPLSAHHGFIFHKPFSQANAYLKSVGYSEVDWRVR